MPNYKEDGKLAHQTNVKKGHRQLDVSIPVFLQELFGIKVGDKFNWYVKRKKDKISLVGVYVKYDSLKYIKGKKIDDKKEDTIN